MYARGDLFFFVLEVYCYHAMHIDETGYFLGISSGEQKSPFNALQLIYQVSHFVMKSHGQALVKLVYNQ